MKFLIKIFIFFLLFSCNSNYSKKNAYIQKTLILSSLLKNVYGNDEQEIFSQILPDGSNLTVYRQNFILINNENITFSLEPSVVGIGMGRFLVSFTALAPFIDPNSTGILGIEFNENGNITTPLFGINQNTEGAQLQSTITNIDLNRTFSSVWISNAIGIASNFEDPNTRIGNEFNITNDLENFLFPFSKGLKNNTVFSVLVDQFSIKGTVFDLSQNIIIPLFNVSDTTNFVEGNFPSIGRLDNGNYMTTWSQIISGSNFDAIGQFFNNDNKKIGNNVFLNPTVVSSSLTSPKVTGIPENFYFTGWFASVDPFLTNIEGAIFDSFGNSVGNIFQINENVINIVEAVRVQSSVTMLYNTNISCWCWTNSQTRIACQFFFSNFSNLTKVDSEFLATNQINNSVELSVNIANISDEKISICFEFTNDTIDNSIACQLLRVEIRRPTLPPFGPINGGGSAIWSLGIILGVGVPIIIIIIIISAMLIGFKKASSDADDDGNTVTLPLQRFQ